MAMSGATLREALSACKAVGNQIRPLDELAAGAEQALRSAPGLTPAGAASFLATQVMESAWLRTTQEYGSGQRYAPFIGRTFEQLTWEANYRSFGRWCAAKGMVGDGECFVRDPRSLADVRWAWLGGVWFFEANNLWRFANAGLFLAVSQAVNGGNKRVGTSFTPNGWVERQKMYNVFLRMGTAILPAGTAPPPQPANGSDSLPELEFGMRNNVHVASLQRFCNLYGWSPALPILPVSGNYLEQTADVIKAAQVQMGVQGGDGRNVGRQTKAGFWARGWRG